MDQVKIDQCTITLTRKCNLRCNFCYAKKTEYIENNIIDYDDLKKVIDFCDEAQVKYIVFTGGEPTLYPRIFDILEYIKTKKHKVQVAIATNGILLKNMEFCNKLVSCGVSYVDISLKGSDEEQCKALVGAECFESQKQAIQNLSRLKLDHTCSMVLTKENIGSLCESVRSSLSQGAKQFSFTFVIDNEKTGYDEDTYWKINDPFELIEAFMMQVEELNSITEEWWIEYSFPLCVYTEEQLNILEGRLAFPCQIHNENGITFDTELNLIPCNMHFEDTIGKLGSDFSSYEEFKCWMKNDTYRGVIDRLKEYPSEECKECSKLEVCYGGCPITWKNFTYRAIQEHKREYYEGKECDITVLSNKEYLEMPEENGNLFDPAERALSDDYEKAFYEQRQPGQADRRINE